ncbi:cytochrome c oxidase assembly factor Coa1 family protein [Lysobacter tyrosinilyticus]
MEALSAAQFGFAPALASALLHSLWQDALLALAAALALAAMTRSSAAARHAVAMLFLLAMVLVPSLQFVHFWQQPEEQVNDGWIPAMESVEFVRESGVLIQQSSPLAGVVVLLWLAGVGAVLLRYARGLRTLRMMERGPHELLSPEWQARVHRLRLVLGITRDVAVHLTRDVVTPCAARVLRPVIWLPASLLTRMPAEQLEALLAHELAHIARKDWLWNGLQCVLEALLFFHPAAWWLGRRIRQEREHACDDLAVAACGDAIALAEALTALERQRQSSPRLVLAANGGSLMQRIKRLLSAPPSRGGWAARIALGAVVTGGILVLAQATLAGNWRPDLRVSSTTEGKLGPGDVREIEANGVDGQRYYRASIDAQGRLTEIYKKDGQSKPIDAGVRRWLAEIDRMSVPPLPPPLPPAPPAPPAIPAPPAPPPVPDVRDSVEFKSLMRLVAADTTIAAKLGTPVTVASGDFDGHIRLDDGDGDADMHFKLRGPKGSGDVHVVAKLDKGVWAAQVISLE